MMRFVVELILLFLGLLTAWYSVTNKRLPRGIIEWMIWTADVVIIALRAAGV